MIGTVSVWGAEKVLEPERGGTVCVPQLRPHALSCHAHLGPLPSCPCHAVICHHNCGPHPTASLRLLKTPLRGCIRFCRMKGPEGVAKGKGARCPAPTAPRSLSGWEPKTDYRLCPGRTSWKLRPTESLPAGTRSGVSPHRVLHTRLSLHPQTPTGEGLPLSPALR